MKEISRLAPSRYLLIGYSIFFSGGCPIDSNSGARLNFSSKFHSKYDLPMVWGILRNIARICVVKSPENFRFTGVWAWLLHVIAYASRGGKRVSDHANALIESSEAWHPTKNPRGSPYLLHSQRLRRPLPIHKRRNFRDAMGLRLV